MSSQWSLQDAKNRFSAVVHAAQQGMPQIVTKRGNPAVVVLSVKSYAAMLRQEKNPDSFASFLLSMPCEEASVFDEFAADRSDPNGLHLREVEF
ncbi:MAG: type II toxin-antitoxin system Phd/YefM family antitoxin [Desulfovibrio sp.]|jgi:prevent-host-death family protein|nr:type II toxin-antitoxin system Phd/YefM family antitoxin [Desulfovibrio sp.]